MLEEVDGVTEVSSGGVHKLLHLDQCDVAPVLLNCLYQYIQSIDRLNRSSNLTKSQGSLTLTVKLNQSLKSTKTNYQPVIKFVTWIQTATLG